MLFTANAAKWNKYTCDKLPGDSGFTESGKSTSKVEIIDDPDIAKNKILMFKFGAPSAQWGYPIEPVDALTIIFRAKSIDTAVISWEIEWRSG